MRTLRCFNYATATTTTISRRRAAKHHLLSHDDDARLHYYYSRGRTPHFLDYRQHCTMITTNILDRTGVLSFCGATLRLKFVIVSSTVIRIIELKSRRVCLLGSEPSFPPLFHFPLARLEWESPWFCTHVPPRRHHVFTHAHHQSKRTCRLALTRN